MVRKQRTQVIDLGPAASAGREPRGGLAQAHLKSVGLRSRSEHVRAEARMLVVAEDDQSAARSPTAVAVEMP